MYRVLITARSFDSKTDGGSKFLVENGCEVIRLTGKQEGLRNLLEQAIGTADAVIAGLEAYDETLLNRAERLKVLSRYGVGYDGIDMEAARARGIAVTITPGANSDSVADLAVALMLSAARHIPYMDRGIKDRRQVRPSGIQMWGKTLGILGAGRIGQGVARRCMGFRMRLLCFDRYRDKAFAEETGAEYVDFDTFIRESDFISLHSPLTGETRNIIGEKQFAMMRPNAVLVNTARGGIIDEQALYTVLKAGRIAAAALDATAVEPAYDSPLLALPNCILTPHAGAATGEASINMSLMAAENARDILYGQKCQFQIK